jgi:GTP1/Obg family GTP-binding protein
MLFDEKPHNSHKEIVNKFWGRLAEIITGPEHERNYLNKLIDKLKNLKEEEEKARLALKKKHGGCGGSKKK